MPAESDKADHAEQGQEVAKDAHKLRQPELAKRFMAQDGLQGIRLWRKCLGRGGHVVNFPPASLSQHKLIVPEMEGENSLPSGRAEARKVMRSDAQIFESHLSSPGVPR